MRNTRMGVSAAALMAVSSAAALMAVSSAAALMAVSTPSFAADVADIAPAARDWTGFYLGIEAGYGWGKMSDSLACPESGTGNVGSVSVITGSGPATCDGGNVVAVTALHNEDGAPWYTVDDLSDIDGWLAGARIGYSQQFGSFVLGAEVEGLVTGMTDDGASYVDVFFTEIDGLDAYYEASVDVDWLVTATAKLGFALTDDFLVSAVGGLAIVRTNFESSAGYSDDSTDTGWTVGASAEYRLTDAVSLTADYKYVQVDNIEYRGSSLFGLIDNRHEYDFKANIVTAGLNYRF